MTQLMEQKHDALKYEAKLLRERLHQIEKQMIRHLSDEDAEQLVRTFLTEWFKTHKGIDAIELYEELHLPGEQSIRIMDKLEKEGFIHES